MGVPQNEWFRMENPTKMDELWVPHFRKPLNGKSQQVQFCQIRLILKTLPRNHGLVADLLHCY